MDENKGDENFDQKNENLKNENNWQIICPALLDFSKKKFDPKFDENDIIDKIINFLKNIKNIFNIAAANLKQLKKKSI